MNKMLCIIILTALAFQFSVEAGVLPFKPFKHPRTRHYYQSVPILAAKVFLNGNCYHYLDGFFYRKSGKTFVIVTPPEGIIIAELPRGYGIINRNRTTYYHYKGIYYLKTSHGYRVTSLPKETEIIPVTGITLENNDVNNDGNESTETILVYVPNSNGSYMRIRIKKTDDGYLGPEKEFYPEFPTVEQLQKMYGK